MSQIQAAIQPLSVSVCENLSAVVLSSFLFQFHTDFQAVLARTGTTHLLSPQVIHERHYLHPFRSPICHVN